MRFFHWPTGASVFAGFLGAGVIDALVVLARGSDAPALAVVALAVGLYGVAGAVLGTLAGWAAGTILGALPARPLAQHEELDARVAGAILAGVAGAVALAVGAAGAHAVFVSRMASAKLATIATGGLVLALCPIAVVVALAFRGAGRAVAARLPRSLWLGRTGLLLALLAGSGVLAGVAALSRADWRVLDLGPMEAAALALVMGSAHALFWYASAGGRRLHPRLPLRAIRVGTVALVGALLFVGRGTPESSPAYQAITDHSLGLRWGVTLARSLSDGDGDGFSARFGGGDCDDRSASIYPGAEDAPGDGIDQNCEGGDAKASAEAAPSAEPAEPVEPPVKPAEGAWKGNILIITIDSLRADRLGVAGYGRPPGRSLTPTLDELAKRGAYFKRVWSQAPNTPRSFPSLVTSRYPSEVAWQQRSLNYSPILPSNQTFFESLARGGWRPIGIFSHFYFTADRNLNQSFAEWSNEGAGTIAESNKDIASPRIVPKVIARLKKAAAAKERFVLWTHLFEPHSSYMEHPEFPTKLTKVAGLEEKYDFEIAFTDRWVGKIMKALEETGLAETTAVVIIADHGEAWGEHKRYFHGQDLTEEQLRVPLIIAIPGRAPVVADDEVALIDVGPTLLDLVGIPAPRAFRGRSLLPRIDGKPLPPRPLFAELLPATAWPKHEVMMVDGGRKLTHRITDRRWELHDLRADPKQQNNLAEDPAHKALLEELKAKLLGFEEGKR
jgi:arylsulfatase A-like enzyme